MCWSIRARGFSTANVYDHLLVMGLWKGERDGECTFDCMCEKLTPSSSRRGGSPSYPSVPNAASQPVLNPPCSPILPLTPCGAPNPELNPPPPGAPYPGDPAGAP